MQGRRLLVLLGLASLCAQTGAAVKVKGFSSSGDAVGTLSLAGMRTISPPLHTSSPLPAHVYDKMAVLHQTQGVLSRRP
jgi:hypothetical protein